MKRTPARRSSGAGFATLLDELKGRIQSAQARAIVSVNSELVRLYWDVGRIINQRQEQEGWGAAVIPRLARALHNELPDLKGFSERNIGRMRAFHRGYPDPGLFLPQPAAKLEESFIWTIPWFHHVILMEKVKDLAARRWYMEQTLASGWSRNILALQIEAQAHRRQGKAISNFASLLPPAQSDLTEQALRDPSSSTSSPSPNRFTSASSRLNSSGTSRNSCSSLVRALPLSAGSIGLTWAMMTSTSTCSSITCACGRSSSSI